jgi:hypothetical protein
MNQRSRNNKFEVLFATAGIPLDARPWTITVSTSRDDWNDFGLHTLADVAIRADQQAQQIMRAHLGFLADDRAGTSNLLTLLRASGASAIPATAEHQFFTMLPNIDAYRKVVEAFGVVIARAALQALNDLVALKEFRSSSKTLRAAEGTEVFAYSFMRSTDAYFAYKNAGPVLRGLRFERLDTVSPLIDLTFRLRNFDNDHKLTFSFDYSEPLPKRTCVVIGKNGVGKSEGLRRLIKAAVGSGRGLSDGQGGRPVFSRILAFAPTGEAEGVFPSDRTKSRTYYRKFSLNRRHSRGASTSDSIVQLARSTERIRDLPRWDIFLSAISMIAEYDQLSLPMKGNEPPQSLKLLRSAYGEQAKLQRYSAVDTSKEVVRFIEGQSFRLSSGEMAFLRFAALASLHVENGSFVLLDEPETHLHPNFINQFVAVLNRLLMLTGSVAIIATHSAYFVREVFREQVIVLKSQSRIISALTPRLKTFGADVGAISFFVFDEDAPSQLALRLREALLAGQWTWDQLYGQFKDDLSPEFLSILRSDLEGAGRS